MSTSLEDRLRTELRENAADVGPAPGYVTATVTNVLARRRRRQVGAVAVAATVAAVVAVGGVALGTQTGDDAKPPTVDRHTPPPQPTPPELDPADMQLPPPPSTTDTLPWRDTGLPQVLPVDVSSAPPLSQNPVDHALALVGGPGASVGVVGEDGRLRRLDGVDLVRPHDSGGYTSSPVDRRSLTPDGGLAAFPQPGSVVVVDLASGETKRFDVPGLNSEVLWHPDRRHVVVGRELGASRILDTVDGSIDDVPYLVQRSAYTPDGDLVESRDLHWYSKLLRWQDDEAYAELAPSSIATGFGIDARPSATDRLLVVTGTTADVHPDDWAYEEGWIVLDIATGRPLSMLRAAAGGYWYDAWLFGLHGWLGDDTVLIQTEDRLLAWTPTTGAIERVSETAGYDLSLATGALD